MDRPAGGRREPRRFEVADKKTTASKKADTSKGTKAA